MGRVFPKIFFGTIRRISNLTNLAVTSWAFSCLLSPGFYGVFGGEGRKPGVFMNPRVIPTCIAFWPGEKELNLHIKHTTLEPKCNQLFLNLGRVSHECR